MKTIFFFPQGEDGEIGPRGLPGESVRLINGFLKFHDKHVSHSSDGDPLIHQWLVCRVKDLALFTGSERFVGTSWPARTPWRSSMYHSSLAPWFNRRDVCLIFLICSFQGVAGVDGPQGPKGNMVWTRPSLTQSAVTFFLTSCRVWRV